MLEQHAIFFCHFAHISLGAHSLPTLCWCPTKGGRQTGATCLTPRQDLRGSASARTIEVMNNQTSLRTAPQTEWVASDDALANIIGIGSSGDTRSTPADDRMPNAPVGAGNGCATGARHNSNSNKRPCPPETATCGRDGAKARRTDSDKRSSASSRLATNDLPRTDSATGKKPGRSSKGAAIDGRTTPPDSPPGEAFAVSFLLDYMAGTGLLTSSGHVLGLASNPARKWGLACELPAGWYVIDDAPRPEQALVRFDMAPARACGWKVTGPQMKSFNPTVPVQIRYGNPKGGCTPEYGVMRAAVYTWCHEEASGDVVEGNIKLIHIYIGRASRNRNMPRRQAGRRTARAEALAVHVCHASSSPLTPAPPRETRTRTARNGSPASPSVIIARSSIS